VSSLPFPIRSRDLPALVPAIAAAAARAEAWVVVVQRRERDRPGRSGDCLMPYTRAQYRVEAAEEWAAVWADATRVAALQPPQPVLIELAPHCRLPDA
jgi:thiamine pyrophosphate-dependent acetolactate synthase large subunit-like protein